MRKLKATKKGLWKKRKKDRREGKLKENVGPCCSSFIGIIHDSQGESDITIYILFPMKFINFFQQSLWKSINIESTTVDAHIERCEGNCRPIKNRCRCIRKISFASIKNRY